MADISAVMGGDLALSASGDLLAVSGLVMTQQRVLRRLLTNPGDYIFQIGYGAGLAAMIGQPAEAARIAAVIRSQMKLERGVGPIPLPAVTVDAQPDGTVTATVRYADQATGASQQIALTP